MKKIRVGILGCGTIGSYLARMIVRKFSSAYQLTCLVDLHQEKALALAKSLRPGIRVVNQNQMVRQCDLVIEAASHKVVGPLVRKVLQKGKSILVMSVGGLLSARTFVNISGRHRGKLFVPSGALSGIDGLLAAKMSRMTSVSLITKKPPQAFAGAPFLKNRRIALEKIRKETLLFQGTARQAVRAFPQNINVAALVSLAGMGPEKTRVKIYASPSLKRNIHRLEIKGDFGRIVTVTENVPSPVNPRTSFLAALSPAALLQKIFSTLKIGT